MEEIEMDECGFCGKPVPADKEHEITGENGMIVGHCHAECWEQSLVEAEEVPKL